MFMRFVEWTMEDSLQEAWTLAAADTSSRASSSGSSCTWAERAAHPTGAWAVRKARNLAMGLGNRIEALWFRFMIAIRSSPSGFAEAFNVEGMRIITTLPWTPRMNAVCDRAVGTLRRELLDQVLILSERHLTLMLDVSVPT
jgi:hypothetical protein